MFIYSRAFDEKYEYRGKDLGAVWGREGTGFKLWAPLAERVELCLYGQDGGDGSGEIGGKAHGKLRGAETEGETPVSILPMTPGSEEEPGVWRLDCPGDLHGIYYDYLVTVEGKTVRSADPYARACGCNGRRSMVVDLGRTDPPGFERDVPPAAEPENVIYELHVKDFSYDPDSGIPEEYRGKFKAFTVPGRQGGQEETATGVRYLTELGVTHVHLLPIFDFGWLDETGDDRQFNWGYDPVNFNVPEGSFATDVSEGTVRIRECKEMVQALHRAGIRVVMDVVYNHMYEKDSWFERTVPGYYCRRWDDGGLSDGSACGNDMAAGRAMVDNYIVDSVLYWAREYHIDGFRFDLMGLLTTELMNRIRRELDAVYGPGEKLLYGEPWRAAESPMEQGTHPALKENINRLADSVAVFSDDTRDVIKGDVFVAESPGFVNGGRGLEEKLLHAVTGWRDREEGFRPNSCSQIVNYISAHDNYTLWDKLLATMTGEEALRQEDYLRIRPDILAANKLAAFICFTCQGHLFLQAGEEFGRTKYGDHNSYRSRPEINMLRWKQAEKFRELVEYYKGLISLRRRLPGLCDKSREAWKRIGDQAVHREGVVSFRVDNRAGAQEGGSREIWDELLVCYNATDSGHLLSLPQAPEAEKPGEPADGAQADRGGEEAEWEILADGVRADCRRAVQGEVLVAPHSGMMLGRVNKFITFNK